jgi:hypothetical protein
MLRKNLGSRLVGNFISGVSPYDPLTYVSVSALLVLVSLFACFVPHAAPRASIP